ncbi:MAG: helix-turn-helix transcriptional regulator [Eubacterium sp.]|nr:helix-turn-helix transcriptional regulator [Eubacterium sp.]
MNRNSEKKIKLCDLSEHTGVTPNYPSSLFKKETGRTIADYIRAQKLNEARRLLSETDLSLSEIADSLAFSSQSYFQNCFKAQFGITLAQYKNDITR